MERSETENWLIASKLLDQVLALPESEWAEAVVQLGTEAGVQKELQELVDGLQKSSCLDESLDSIFCHLPSTVINKNVLSGRNFGGWLLNAEIGRGGMSVVYAATRSGDGFEQNAAFKILSIAFGTEKHIESFLQERQILSEMTHPGIARMIDAGVTDDGAPFLVMEQIVGQRIDQYCEEQSISKTGIVRLMEQLCRAVAHAHRHLVVHRDINPSNVLIDQRGRPVLVDFGIAKIIGEAETGNTIMAYTPEFAAPEQKTGGAITTATDVYGLGATLKRLLNTKSLDKELKAIIHIATHEDPNLRYTTAKAMGDDLQAWLENRPVVARPDSWTYRFGKFARRHWQWLSVACVAVVVAIAGVVGTTLQAEISRAEAEKHQAVADFMLGIFEQANLMQSGSDLRVTELLEGAAELAQKDLAGQPEALVALLVLVASGQMELTNYNSAGIILDEADSLINNNDISAATRSDYYVQRGRESYELGDFTAAVQHLETALELLNGSAVHDNNYFLVAADLVAYLVDSEKYDEARTLAERLDKEVKRDGSQAEAVVHVTHRYAIALEVTGEIEPALQQYEQALQLQQAYQASNLLGRAAILQDFGIAYYFADRFAESETINREVLDIFNAQFDAPHPRISSALHNLAFSMVGQEKLDEAIPLLTQSYEMSVKLHGPDHIDTLLEQATLGSVMGKVGDYELAEPVLRQNIASLLRVAPEMKVQRGSIHLYLGDLLVETQRVDQAKVEYLSALELFDELPTDHVRVTTVNQLLDEIAEQ